jgi:hypothetical protein
LDPCEQRLREVCRSETNDLEPSVCLVGSAFHRKTPTVEARNEHTDIFTDIDDVRQTGVVEVGDVEAILTIEPTEKVVFKTSCAQHTRAGEKAFLDDFLVSSSIERNLAAGSQVVFQCDPVVRASPDRPDVEPEASMTALVETRPAPPMPSGDVLDVENFPAHLETPGLMTGPRRKPHESRPSKVLLDRFWIGVPFEEADNFILMDGGIRYTVHVRESPKVVVAFSLHHATEKPQC